MIVASVSTRPSARFSTIARQDSSRNSGSYSPVSLAEQQLERAVGGFVVVAAVLEFLDPLDQPPRLAVAERDSRVAGPRVHGALARQLGDQQFAPVADDVGVEVLERRRIDVDAGHVHPALVGERVAPDVRLVGVGREVQDLVEEVRGLGQRGELLGGHALVAELQLQVGDDRDQVRVAAPLAVAVHRPLYVDRALLDRGQRAGDAAPRVVVAVDPDCRSAGGRERRDDIRHRGGEPMRERAAVRVAAGNRVGARLGRRDHAAERVRGVVREPVEEVLGVVDHALALADEERDGLGDHPQVLVAIDLHDLLEVKAPALADDRAHGRARLGEHAQPRIGVGARVAATGHPERRDLRVAERLSGQQPEQLELLGVRAREARLDHVDPELVEAMRHPQLLLRGQRHALPLHPVAEGRVVELDVGHVDLSAAPDGGASAGCGSARHLDHVEPLGVARVAAVQRVVEHALDLARDRSGLAGADRVVVDLAHRARARRPCRS